MFYIDAKKKAIERLKKEEKSYKDLGELANEKALNLYSLRKSAVLAINRAENYINSLAHSPKEFAKDVSDVQVAIREFVHAVEIEKQNSSDNIKGAGAASVGLAAGSAIAALGPSAAMAVATLMGTASTGTAIASLSGAAATNAALAWLGGGALAAGGGGMSAGSAFLAMAGPVGWVVAGVAFAGGGCYALLKNKAAAEKANEEAQKIHAAICKLKPLYESLLGLFNDTYELKESLNIIKMVNTYPKDYNQFSDDQKKDLAALVNNIKSMGVLINKRIN